MESKLKKLRKKNRESGKIIKKQHTEIIAHKQLLTELTKQNNDLIKQNNAICENDIMNKKNVINREIIIFSLNKQNLEKNNDINKLNKYNIELSNENIKIKNHRKLDNINNKFIIQQLKKTKSNVVWSIENDIIIDELNSLYNDINDKYNKIKYKINELLIYKNSDITDKQNKIIKNELERKNAIFNNKIEECIELENINKDINDKMKTLEDSIYYLQNENKILNSKIAEYENKIVSLTIKRNDKQLIKHNDKQLIKQNDKQLIKQNDKHNNKHNDKQLIEQNDKQLIEQNDKQLIEQNDKQLIEQIDKQLIEQIDKQLIKYNDKQLIEQNDEINKYKLEIRHNEFEIVKLKNYLDRCKKNETKLIDENDVFVRKFKQKELEIFELNNKIRDYEKKIKMTQEDINLYIKNNITLTANLEEKNAKLNELSHKYLELQKNNSFLENKQNLLINDTRNVKEQLNKVINENSILKNDIKQKEVLKRELENVMERTNIENKKTILSLKIDIDKMQNKLIEIETQKQNIESNFINELNDTVEQNESKELELKIIINKLEEEIEKINKDNNKLENKLSKYVSDSADVSEIKAELYVKENNINNKLKTAMLKYDLLNDDYNNLSNEKQQIIEKMEKQNMENLEKITVLNRQLEEYKNNEGNIDDINELKYNLLKKNIETVHYSPEYIKTVIDKITLYLNNTDKNDNLIKYCIDELDNIDEHSFNDTYRKLFNDYDDFDKWYHYISQNINIINKIENNIENNVSKIHKLLNEIKNRDIHNFYITVKNVNTHLSKLYIDDTINDTINNTINNKATEYERDTFFNVVNELNCKIKMLFNNSLIAITNLKKYNIDIHFKNEYFYILNKDLLEIEKPNIALYLSNSIKMLEEKNSTYKTKLNKLSIINTNTKHIVNQINVDFIEIKKYQWNVEKWFLQMKKIAGLKRTKDILRKNINQKNRTEHEKIITTINEFIINIIKNPLYENNILEHYSSLNYIYM